MKIAFIGDIVGSPGRAMIKEHVSKLKREFSIDLVIANGENASHGFGLTQKNAKELFASGVDMITGGNHTWDRKEIIPLFDTMPILRPLNYPEGVEGKGVGFLHVRDESLAVINAMGHFSMPMVENPFIALKGCVQKLRNDGIKNILIDFHAESTAEKRALHMLLKGQVSAIMGTHTHIGTDDLSVQEGTCYVSDVGMSGCRDNVIGMEAQAPLKRFLTGLPASLDVPKKCKKIFQMVVMTLEDGLCKEAFKVRIYEGAEEMFIQKAFYE
ncbi:MAG: TIGR00282 family metallophosphoesterase [Sulfurospirillaceae bacterium]|nr:TIGR00282 family metallophosphoesterase [Sulfurospirillaceae bacterium]